METVFSLYEGFKIHRYVQNSEEVLRRTGPIESESSGRFKESCGADSRFVTHQC